MNDSPTSILKRLSVAVALTSVVLAVAAMGLHQPGAGASLPRPTSLGASAAPTAPMSSTTTASTGAVGRRRSGGEPATGAASVLSLQRRLAALGYDVGNPDGLFGERTSESVMAFQKIEGLAPTGTPGPDVIAALATATPPRALVPDGDATRVEIDLRRQVLLFWDHGELSRILPVSTGSGRRYCLAGVCQVAATPKGLFHIGRKVAGVDRGPLGPLYYPMYFSGGVAIHGAPSVPATPASHGCVRVPMYAASGLFEQVPSGTAVYVI